MEHRHPALRVRRRPHPAPDAVQSRPGLHQVPARPEPGPRGPVIAQIYAWRAVGKFGCPAIAARLNANPVSYPPPNPGTGWTAQNVRVMRANPKYTGKMGLRPGTVPATAHPAGSVAVVTGPERANLFTA